ncbi:two-component sensor histidine kinase [Actinomyces viscosus]|uniref:histidine kinase n=1 Tax=Actinomyces viscosus TaxID=1656 RepID=A0A3S4VFI6_ACTVI|nr:histidine kinase [Actinomyces viscosus]TFH53330.1 two-component sensor histidine kinase [Actinomyces viscosus]VEI17997.1 sensory histidine kinase UhpB [Actinomyces viscosus]
MPASDLLPRHSPLGRAITGLTLLTVATGTLVGFSPTPSWGAQVTMLLVMAGLVAASLWLRRRDRRAHERRLAQETAARAIAEDRLVIARELHDAVSGNLGAITVRCAVAQRLETTPEGLRSALGDVETASREATEALRRMLTVLRDESTPPTPGAVAEVAALSAAATTSVAGADSAGAADAPGGSGSRPGERRAEVIATGLTEVVDRARRAGVTVEIDAAAGAGAGADTDPSSAVLSRLPAPAARAAVRVVTEALANTARHAGPTRARVTLRRKPGLLRIAVDDDGPAADWEPRPGAGQGLRGLHERLTALGGTLAAGPRPDAPGFAVEATIPAEPLRTPHD